MELAFILRKLNYNERIHSNVNVPNVSIRCFVNYRIVRYLLSQQDYSEISKEIKYVILLARCCLKYIEGTFGTMRSIKNEFIRNINHVLCVIKLT